MRQILVPVILACCLIAAPAAGEGAQVIELKFENGRFVPDHVTAPAGEKLLLRVHNASAEPFNFEIEAINLTAQVRPGAVKDVRSLDAPQPGLYRFVAEARGQDEDSAPHGQLEVK